MIDLTFDITTGIAELVGPVTFKAAGDVFVRVTFSASPGTMAGDAIKLAIGTDEIAPETLAYTQAFTQVESSAVWTATLDAGDSRLVDFMANRGPEPVNADLIIEIVCTIAGKDKYAPSLPCVVEPPVFGDLSGSTGGPYQAGDLLYASSTSVLSKLHIGTEGQVLKSSGGFPAWGDSTGGGGGLVGSVLPEGYVAAALGTVYARIGTLPFSFYMKTSGGNTNTGWTQFIGNDNDVTPAPFFDSNTQTFDDNTPIFDQP